MGLYIGSVSGDGSGWVGSIAGLFLPASNLGPYTKEKELAARKEFTAPGAVRVLEGENEGRTLFRFIGGGGFDPARFLSDVKGGVVRVMSGE